MFIMAVLSVGSSMGQATYSCEFSVKGLNNEKITLYSYYGDQRTLIDSTLSDGKGYFFFMFDTWREPGIYHLSAGKENGMDFIFNQEECYIRIDKQFTPDSAVVTKSLENKLLFEYLSKKLYYEIRLELLRPLIYYYPADDPFFPDIEKQHRKLEEGYHEYLDRTYAGYPDLIATRFIKFDQLEDIRPGEISPQQAQYLKQHYFDGIDLSDTLLLYSPLLPGRIIDYLSLYVSPGIGKEKQEGLFKQAIDSLMSFTLPGNKVREVVINYLVEGFQAYGLEEVMSYLVENYVLNQACVSEQREEILKNRIEGFKKLAVGNTAADFELTDRAGEKVLLSALPYDYKILFFWSSDCPHCSAAIPGMKRLREAYLESAVFISVSVDSDGTAWEKAVEDKALDWINVAELQGWDGKTVKDYYIYATPTILVLSRDLEILAKPTGVRDLEVYLEASVPGN